MPQMFIVSWPDDSNVSSANGTPVQNFKWHFVTEESAEVTRCCRPLPSRQNRSYAEIQTEQMKEIKGFCFVCFHDLCISEQDQVLWQLYEKVESLNSSLYKVHTAITNAKCSPTEIESALALFEQLHMHPVIESLTGK